MKGLSKFIILILMGLLTGCASTNEELKDDVLVLERFRKIQIEKIVNYMEKDPNITRRDVNTFHIELKIFDESLEKIKEYFSKK